MNWKLLLKSAGQAFGIMFCIVLAVAAMTLMLHFLGFYTFIVLGILVLFFWLTCIIYGESRKWKQ